MAQIHTIPGGEYWGYEGWAEDAFIIPGDAGRYGVVDTYDTEWAFSPAEVEDVHRQGKLTIESASGRFAVYTAEQVTWYETRDEAIKAAQELYPDESGDDIP